MLTLHSHPLSTFGRRVRIALLEKGLEAEWVTVNVGKKEHLTPEYLALNPYGRLPTLNDGEWVLYESTAILSYLEAKWPTPALLPAEPRLRAEVEQQIKLCDLEFTYDARALFFPARFLPRASWDEPTMERTRERIRRHFENLERRLEGRTWLVGEQWSMAELCYTPFTDFLEVIGISAAPNTAGWIARMQSRPSARATRLDR